jgi:hypothetical protein
MGSLHEFTTALEAHMPCGVLLGSGGLADAIPNLIKDLELPHGTSIVFDTDPIALVRKVVKILDEMNSDMKMDELKEDWMVKASVCEPLAGKHGFKSGQLKSSRQG